MPTLTIRPSTAADLPALTDIYGHAVAQGTGTFELDCPDEAEMARRRDDVLAKGLPWLVTELGGQVAGYAYATPFRPRPAYRYCVEDSIYLHPDAQGRGIGRWLLAELVARCEAAGARQMLAVIGDSANAASIAAHAALGFEHCGSLHAAGWKFSRWLDVSRYRSKTLATWAAVLGGTLGLHRFYLHGWRDLPGWLFPVPTLFGLAGVQRMRAFGQDDGMASLLIPVLGLMISVAMLTAIVYGLTPDAKWDERYNRGQTPRPTGWAPVLAVITALLLGASVLMGTVAFSGQRFFEWQAERSSSGS